MSAVYWRRHSYGASIWNGHAMMGVVTVGNPVAPALNGRGILKASRLCLRGDLTQCFAGISSGGIICYKSAAVLVGADDHLCGKPNLHHPGGSLG
jgi:hypothetical protein